jgi:hypothetical protein
VARGTWLANKQLIVELVGEERPRPGDHMMSDGVRFAMDSPLEEGGFELVVPLCLGIDIVIGDSSLVPREFGLARQAYGAIA